MLLNLLKNSLWAIWYAVVAIVCVIAVLPFLLCCIVIEWVFRSRSERIVRRWLRCREPNYPIGWSWSKRLPMNKAIRIVGVARGDITGLAARYFQVDVSSREVVELEYYTATKLLDLST